jgi:branched-chain amino acid transport system ATP-binding protein
MMTEPRLASRGITVRFGGLAALDGIDIAVGDGEIVGLIGPNGAGKSTLFAVLSGLLRPNTGRVFMSGHEVTRATPQARAMRGLGRTFQHPELFQGLTVREQVTLAHRIKHAPRRVWTDAFTAGGLRRPSKEESKRIDRVLDDLQITEIQHHPAAGLPLGQCRLVEIARSIAREPSVLLLDEASSGLDAQETDQLAGALKALVTERQVSLLLVEHDVDLVMSLVDRAYVLDFGRLIADGTPAQVRESPLVRAASLGEQVQPSAIEAT